MINIIRFALASGFKLFLLKTLIESLSSKHNSLDLDAETGYKGFLFGVEMKKIKLSNKGFALVDDEDFESMNKRSWFYHNGYARTAYGRREHQKRRYVFMHRLIMNTPENMHTDHINGNRADNRKKNLRICDNSKNRMNVGVFKNNETGYKGVGYHPSSPNHIKCWRARIQTNKKPLWIGYYYSAEDAARAYDKAAIKYFGEFAKLNFPISKASIK